MVWAGKDRTAATLRQFFDDLGPDRAAALTPVSADGAEFIHTVVTERAPRAVLCLDAFHVVAWATKALDALRRALATQLRRTGHPDQATTIKHTRWALLAGWISWVRRSRIPAFARLATTITRFRDLILNAVEHGLSNARSEATNTHPRLLTRRAHGYHSPDALIAMADLTRGGLCPPLPGRS